MLPPVTSNGDLNEDGVIDVGDLALASKYYGENKPEYDMDGDGIVGDYEIETISEKILE
ncbi:dockerin type I domain-containing protein [Clostridium sp. B9]|uniref:dockerin type I domain-containing protein n=1 Tax=Clostridium sp. B9 TaxID=3423224 RepID=UPI003D2EB794